jgi:hypothetical protein
MVKASMSSLPPLPHAELTLACVGAFATLLGIWIFVIVESTRHRSAKGVDEKPPSIRLAVLITLVLGGVTGYSYYALATIQHQRIVALGHATCRSWRFGTIAPDQSLAATVVGRAEGIADFTCEDASNHFVDLAKGRAVPEPPGFFTQVGVH